MNESKILPIHLSRQAVVYIRQSSPMQVERNIESQKRQYQLVEKAQALGWPAAQCTVIDDDLGVSGAKSYNRPGYQRLISMLALREVGIVLGLEVSRLARNNLDWYQLLELAATFDVLISDEDGLYDPADFNDRLLLGLKGTISEVELYQIKARMVRGRLNKARRGELVWLPPVGLELDPVTKQIGLSSDEGVRHSLEMVFQLYRQLGSVRGVLQYLHRSGLELPYRRVSRGLGQQIGWRQATYDELHHILTNPTYAGVYCYGRRRREYDPVDRTYHVHRQDPSEWEVYIPSHHPGYITLAEFEENQRVLENNRYLYPRSQGAAREGSALLQGLARCEHCGHKMRLRYGSGGPYYVCDSAHRRFGEPICNRGSARRVDALVEELFLSVMNVGTLEMSLSHHEKLRREAALVDRAWREKLERLEYQSELARRRYELVEPENRLVVRTLEREWNDRLEELEAARREHEAQRSNEPEITSTLAEMRQVVEHLRDHWYREDVTPDEKKGLLRCLIEGVWLENRGKVIKARVVWHGGAVSELFVPKYLFSSPYIYHRVHELGRSHTDAEIADMLNSEGTVTVKGRPWTARRVMDFRLSNSIPSGFTTNSGLRAAESGYVTTAEAAAQLGVCQETIQKWYRLGVLAGKHHAGQSQLWIRWGDDVVERLGGGVRPDLRMVSVRSLSQLQGKSWEEVVVWASGQGYGIYRLRRGTALRFYILPHANSVQH